MCGAHVGNELMRTKTVIGSKCNTEDATDLEKRIALERNDKRVINKVTMNKKKQVQKEVSEKTSLRRQGV